MRQLPLRYPGGATIFEKVNWPFEKGQRTTAERTAVLKEEHLASSKTLAWVVHWLMGDFKVSVGDEVAWIHEIRFKYVYRRCYAMIKASGKGGHKVAFVNATTKRDLLINLREAVQTASIKWKDDKWG